MKTHLLKPPPLLSSWCFLTMAATLTSFTRVTSVSAAIAMPHIAHEELSAFIAQAHNAMHHRLQRLEPEIHRKGVKQVPGTPAWVMAASHSLRNDHRNLTQAALLDEETTKYMTQALGLTKEQVHLGLPEMDISATTLSRSCPEQMEFPCEAHKYRSMSGHCNNVQNPQWGQAGTRYLRFMPPDYADGISLPRGTPQFSGRLPSAREVSLIVHSHSDIPHSHLVVLSAVWAQFIAHDISLTPQMTGYKGERLKCCGVEFSDFHPECFPIRLPDGDPVHGPSHIRCQDYARSASAPRTGCTLGTREQMNGASSYLDGSVIYGNSQTEADQLRTFKDGLLKVQQGPSRGPLLPPEENSADCRQSFNQKCFKSGDSRVNVHVGLAALHTLWVREHNRIAWALARLNPHWVDEILYQEARRIVIAELQHITYSEFLPLVLGKEGMALYDLQPEADGYYKHYDMNLNPAVSNTAASAALYYFISLMPKHMGVFDEQGRHLGDEMIGSSFYAPFSLYKPDGLDSTMRSMLKSSAQSNNQHINSILTNHMFQQSSKGTGLDLPAQLIQQGRDHGIPAYVKWLSHCKIADVKSFRDLRAIMPESAITDLQAAYLNWPMSCSSGVFKPLDLTPWQEARPHILVSSHLLNEAITRAHRDVNKILEQEYDLYINNRMADPQSPVGTAYGFSRPKRQAAQIANNSLILEYASASMVRNFLKGELQDLGSHDVKELLSVLPSVDVSSLNMGLDLVCDETALPCDHTRKYRTITGWCNNLHNPSYGKSFQPFIRLLSSVYEDGVGSPRSLSILGKPLPSPRRVSTNIHTDISRPHTRYSLMVMQLAQITDHDLTFTPVGYCFINEGILNCLACDSMVTFHPQCFPIPVPEDDPYFPAVNETTGEPFCIPATRSMPGQRTLGPREQTNQLTAYLDLSFVYGSDVCEARILRSLSGGKLNYTRHPTRGKPLLPQIAAHPECRSPSRVCFRAGDERASEQPGLTALHTIYMREHNRIAAGLAGLNPHWNDETLYQEARRILTAVHQHIEFNEFLPRIFGWDGVRKHGLTLLNDGYYDGYDDKCEATILNEFAAACFRFGHSLLRPHFRRVDHLHRPLEPPVRLRDHFFNPDIIFQTNIVDEIILGLLDTPMETLDNFITEEVTNHLFEKKAVPFSGMDLVSLNIQRARDHGIRGYNFYREACNMTKVKTFDELYPQISLPLIESLKSIYEHVDDIDLFPGGMSETPLPGGVLGPTFACVVGHQFRRLRSCDRFWYETSDPLLRFTPTQLTEIRKMSLSRILCSNLDNAQTMQRSALDLEDSFMNPRVPCSSIPSLDLSAWKDRASCSVGSVTIDIGATEHVSPCVTCTCTKEGPICQSLRIANCFHLANSFSADAVLNDTVCKVQCAFVFRALQELSETTTDNQLGFS
ncbi:hypothetical protein LSTR_LSTR009092 [Laodelphax striatellus]|uniref:Uncharacterized protein n=1 Tax=Laodelphax striatellus TaxID=195883 RepID=A0A482XP90_LAOST|nr:hypothetical protein LSTR_LSTR009092 [Laodelphax striatellus]